MDAGSGAALAARAEAAQAWLWARAGPERAPSRLSAGSVRTVEAARALLSAEADAAAALGARGAAIEERRARSASALASAACAEGDSVVHHPLAGACGALRLGEDVSRPQRIAAASEAASELASARADAARAEAERSAAASEAAAAAGTLADARAASATARDATAARASDARRAWARAGEISAKAGQYAAGAGEARGRVRASGVAVDCTHDALAEAAGRVQRLKEATADAERELSRFGDLPAVSLHANTALKRK